MMPQRLLFIIFFLISWQMMVGQQRLAGTVYSGITDSVIRSASIINKTAKSISFSAADGRYTIAAAEGDTLIFSAIGYVPDTITVAYHMLLTFLDVTLTNRIISLEEVTVTGTYQSDSLARREEYKHIFKKQPGITGFNRPQDGFGIVFSPVSYFSKRAKQKRVLKKRLLQQEHDSYIDLVFPVEWVAKLTGLKGDSLNLFMYRFRPSYDFCRHTDRAGLVVYINDKLKLFRKEN